MKPRIANTGPRLLVLAAVAVCCTATGAAVAVAAAPGQGGSSAARHQADLSPAAEPVVTTSESKFVPLAPCRIVDTRAATAGPLIGGTPRSFYAAGTGAFPAQGGLSGGCGVPFSATAVDVSFQAVNATGTGYVNETPYGTAFGVASLLHYVKGQTIGTGATFPINTNGAFDFTLKASSNQTDVLVDVVGYYTRPLTVLINADATFGAGTQVSGATNPSPGVYKVDFTSRNISACAYSVTPASGGEAQATPTSGDAQGVTVTRTDSGGTPANGAFYLVVTC